MCKKLTYLMSFIVVLCLTFTITANAELVGSWKLDDGTGAIAADSSANSNDGAILGEPQWIDGWYGGGLMFDGDDDYINLPIGALVSSLNECSLSTWVNWSGQGGIWQRVFDIGSNTTFNMFLTPTNGASVMRFAITINGSAGEDMTTADTPLPTGWHHLAVTINPAENTHLLYLDAEVVAEKTDARYKPSDLGETTQNWIGRSQYSADPYFEGSIDDFRIYNNVLTQEEVMRVKIPGDARLAWNPGPALGSMMDIKHTQPISWSPGDGAAEHDVYFGTDQSAVEAADASDTTGVYRERQPGTSYNPPEGYEWGQTYYWRIDEVGSDATVGKGMLWSFTVTDYLVVDDFEDYNDIEPDTIYLTWIDGYGDPTNGSTAGYPDPDFVAGGHFVETDNIHGGNQCLPLFYDNSTASYSEITANTNDLPIGRDWTPGSGEQLVLWLHGDPINATTNQLYVKINSTKITYSDDAANLAKPWWIQWNIDLAAEGVTLSNVTSVSIGIERTGANGGTGMLFLDDIRLYRTAPEAAEEIWIEAEAADSIESPMMIFDDLTASGGKYIMKEPAADESSANPPEDGLVTYSFTVTGGVYKIHGRVITEGNNDSFWLQIPGATTQTANHASGWVNWNGLTQEVVWGWDVVHSSNDGAAEVEWTIPAGTHTLQIRYREDASQLDALVIQKIN